MKPSVQKIEQALSRLVEQFISGYFEFCFARFVHRARMDGQIKEARTFFAGAENSLFDNSILALSILIFRDTDSVSIDYFLNCAEQTPAAFPRAQEPALLNTISQHREQLKRIRERANNIKELRDRTIAHVDKKWVNDSTYTRPPLDYDEIERMFTEINQIMGVYKLYLNPPEDLSGDLERIRRLAKADVEKIAGSTLIR